MKSKGLDFVGMGFELGAVIIGGLHVGQVLDRHFGWPGYGVSGMVITCMIGWFYHLIILLKRFMDDDDDQTSDTSPKGSN